MKLHKILIVNYVLPVNTERIGVYDYILLYFNIGLSAVTALALDAFPPKVMTPPDKSAAAYPSLNEIIVLS